MLPCTALLHTCTNFNFWGSQAKICLVKRNTKKAPRAKKGGKIQFPRILLPWIKRSHLCVILKHCEWKHYFWHLTWRTKHNNNLIFIQKSLIQWTTQRKTLVLLQIDTLQISQFWRECKIVFEANKTSNILYLTGNELSQFYEGIFFVSIEEPGRTQ